MADVNDIANQAAVLLSVSDELLDEWLAKQLGWLTAHLAKLKAAANNSSPRSLQKRKELHLRIGLAEWTIDQLRQKQHFLCCEHHGVQGVKIEDWVALAHDLDTDFDAGQFYTAMANRGVFDMEDGDYLTWAHDCERCLEMSIKELAEREWAAPWR